MRIVHAVLVAAGVTLCAATLAGCTAPVEGKIELPPRNQAEWVMPLDPFTVDMAPRRDYAEALLIAPCMTESGFDFPVPWQPEDRGRSESYSAGGDRLFTVALAERFGYHAAPTEWEGKEDWLAFGQTVDAIAARTPGYDDALVACRDEARDVVPLPSDDALYFGAQARAQSWDQARVDPAVVDAAQGWRECMTGSGFGGIDTGPDEMPGADLTERWQTTLPGTEAGADEIAMAVADARCSEESGWNAAAYDAQWKAQAAFIEANEDRLLRVRTEIEDTLVDLEEVIRENAPAR